MPYILTVDENGPARLRAWPHNALNPRGFAIAIGLAAAALAIPLIAVLGTPALWGVLPFAAVVVWGLWFALERNWRDRRILEEMTFSRSAITLTRTAAQSLPQHWRADPHFTALKLLPRAGPVENYLILSGGGREVELGAFLTPAERLRLHDELQALLIRLKSYA